MNTATGMHIAGQTLRLVALKQQGETCELVALCERPLSHPFSPEVLAKGHPNSLSDDIRRALSDIPSERLIAVLTGSFFHIQKVPLEMAAENDRREQIIWEATQALIPPAEAHEIDFFPAGRVAFWTATRKDVLTAFADLTPHVPLTTIVEPLALFSACQISGIAQSGRHIAIHMEKTHRSYVALDNGALTAAETVRTEQPSARADQQLRHWVLGDMASDRRTPASVQTHFCGDTERIEAACRQFAHQASPPPVELKPFARIPANTTLPPNQSAFAIAAGAAFWSFGHT